MKKFFLSMLIFFLMADNLFSQNNTDTLKTIVSGNETIKTSTGAIETAAYFKEGEQAWAKFLKKNIDYDIASFNDAPRGIYKARVKFTVFADGKLGNFKALTNYGYGMENEMIRALKKSPPWNPATKNGQPVETTRTLQIYFGVEVL